MFSIDSHLKVDSTTDSKPIKATIPDGRWIDQTGSLVRGEISVNLQTRIRN
jgi:hypothetical protein